ncbi:hypothetical protein ST47_g1533 [Ascochyta rabiei]|uniref:Uncharacterized protein n=2 Tax=Didymella rabiei TaxID=5454 RepID=A0A163KXI5_DIDRA|nr:hypothetical protein ST47_g1533 [Ascochyta rabiei]
MVELAPETKLKADKTDWEFYESMQATEGKKEMRITSSIAPELLLSAVPNYWTKVEDVPDDHVKDAFLRVLVGMTGLSEADIRGGMPAPKCKKSKA